VTICGAVDILVVEDNKSQRDSIVESLEASINGVCVVAIPDGEEALDFLFAREAWVDRAGEEPPRLILLDLDLPGADAFSILGQIRSLGSDDALLLTPVVIFTDSQSERNTTECYRCGANSYLIKPLGFLEFRTLVDMLGQYWITHNRTPN
jgi:two-component system response regulator